MEISITWGEDDCMTSETYQNNAKAVEVKNLSSGGTSIRKITPEENYSYLVEIKEDSINDVMIYIFGGTYG